MKKKYSSGPEKALSVMLKYWVFLVTGDLNKEKIAHNIRMAMFLYENNKILMFLFCTNAQGQT